MQVASIGPRGEVFVKDVQRRRAEKKLKRQETQQPVLWTWIDSVEVTADWHDDCSICIEPFQASEMAKKLPCGHTFHATCCLPWFACKTQCPYCRFDVEKAMREAQRVSDDSDFEL